MAGRVSVIIGTGNDIGLAIAQDCLERGHSVLVADTSRKRADALEAALDGPILVRHDDAFDGLTLSNYSKEALQSFGRVDQVIYIPPIPKRDDLSTLDPSALGRKLSTSAVAATTLLQVFSDIMAEQDPYDDGEIRRQAQSGAITFVLSMTSLLSDPWRVSECVLQSSMIGIVRTGAVALAARHIRVNAIAAVRPRAERRLETNGDEQEPGEKDINHQREGQWLRARTPLGRAALADEIARTVRFLNSDDAGFITGETLRVDGGRSALNGVISD